MTDQPVAEDDDDLEDGEFDDELDDDADDDLDDDDELGDDEDDDDDDEDEDEDDDDDEDDDGPDGNRRAGALPIAMLEYVAKSLVDDPESVVVDVEEGRRALTLRLHVDPSDMGRVIGRRGRVAQAIRTVVRAAGAREGTETVVDIVD
ncbi:MAG: KH domain-containing protein [Actinomycetota bacterium]